MWGGARAYIFVLLGDGVTDCINDFEPGVDRIDMSQMGRFYTVEALQVSSRGNGIEFQINGSIGNDMIQGTEGVDTIAGEGGGDTIMGGSGNDLLLGGRLTSHSILWPPQCFSCMRPRWTAHPMPQATAAGLRSCRRGKNL